MTTPNPTRALGRIDACTALSFLAILTIALVHLVLVFSGAIGLRNGDFSGRLVVAFQTSFTSHYLQTDLWHFIWPPLPFLVHKALWSAFGTLGIGTETAIKLVLGVSILLGAISLELLRRIAVYFSNSAGGLAAVLCASAIPYWHVVFTSIAGQAFAFPFWLIGVLLLSRAIGENKPVYAAAACFLLASLCRAESVMYGGISSLLLLRAGRVRDFFSFNLIAGSFFLIHQFRLTAFGSMSYTNLTRYYDYSDMTTLQLAHMLNREIAELFQVPPGATAWIVVLLVMVMSGVAGVFLIRSQSGQRRTGYASLVVLPLATLFMMANPFLSENLRAPHARDLLYGFVVTLLILAIVATIYLEKRRSALWLLPIPMLTIAALSGYAIYSSTSVRQPGKEVDEVLAWLNAHRQPTDAVVLDADWSEYLHAHLARTKFPDVHWSFGRAFFELETTIGPRSDDSKTVYERCVQSATKHIWKHDVRYIVTYPAKTPDKALRQGPPHVRHRERKGFAIDAMSMVEPDRWMIQDAEASPHVLYFRRVYQGKAFHVWEREISEHNANSQ